MAAQNKTTAVHFSLIFFVMLSVILGVVAYLFFADYREQQAILAKAQSDLAARDVANKKYVEEVGELKKLLGIELPDVGLTSPDDPKTVLGQGKAVIRDIAKNPAAPSLVAALQDLRSQIDKQTVDLAERQTTNDRLNAEMAALNKQYKDRADVHDKARMTSEGDLASVQQKNDETIAAKDKDLAAHRQQVAGLQTELAQNKDQMGATIRGLETQVHDLSLINDKLRTDLDKIKGEGFEVADGVIRRIDQVARTVWINLGSKDGLRPRTTFSVYEKNNNGIGRSAPSGGRAEDIKGAIEVTRIIEAHLAEARILSDSSSSPISPGDPIYSPLWGRGRREQFAFVGMIDMDGDKSFVGDRERLHEVVAAHGAEISAEVEDDGTLVGGPVDEQTKFLVIGTIPDPSQEPDEARKSQLKAMGNHQKEMIDQAHQHGVTVMRLNQFLDYVGYVPQQRVFIPGSGKAPFEMRAGSASGISARPNSRSTSSGNTSSLFGGRGGANPTSNGNASQVFGGNR